VHLNLSLVGRCDQHRAKIIHIGEDRPSKDGVTERFEETLPAVIGKRKVCMDSLRPCTGKGLTNEGCADNFFLTIDANYCAGSA